MKSSLPQFWEHFSTRYDEIEKEVEDKEGAYTGHSQEALYTSSEDLDAIFRHELIKGTFCDLGCGTGRSALLYGYRFPERKAIGIEFDRARVEAGQKFILPNVSLIHDDLLTCRLPDADTYFLYFPTGPVLDRVLSELYKSSGDFVVVAIESHGDLLPRLDLENWLMLRDEVELTSMRHYPKARIYQRIHEKRNSSLFLFEHSYRESFLLVSSGQECWIGESQGLTWLGGECFNLLYPPRTIHLNDVKKLMTRQELRAEWELLCDLRRQGEIEIRTLKRSFRGTIRKIILDPMFLVEISSGERIEWTEILTITQGSSLCYKAF